MDNDSGLCGVDEQIELPPGFRFHPTDEELITHYLSQKVLDSCFNSTAIGDVDLNKVEPWDLPWKAKMGEREWYFFCIRDRKYPTGLRTNRATDAGYWKATGKDKEIYRGKALVGMKKTLVFYKGRAPKGSKTNWVMHEYRLEGKCSLYNLPKTAKNEWVISRIFQKNSSGKRTHISGLVKMSDSEDELQTSNLPPLMDCSSALDGQTRSTAGDTSHVSHVTCFSDLVEEKNHHDQMVDSFINPLLGSSSASKPMVPKSSVSDSPFSTQFVPNMENFGYLESSLMQDQSMMRFLVQNMKREPNSKAEFSNHEIGQRYFVGQEDSILSGGPVDLDCLWNY